MAVPIPAWLEGDVITLAWCWRIARRDGAELGFTTHDVDIVRDNLLYRAAPGMDPSAIRIGDSLDGDTMDVAGALTHAAITEIDLVAGRYDGAIVSIFLVDWENPSEPPIMIANGRIAGITQQQSRFRAELSLRHPGLDAGVGISTSPTCRARLGDAACHVDMAGRKRIVRVAAITGTRLTIAEPLNPNVYAHGELRWIDGAMAGKRTGILAQTGSTLTLTEPLAILPSTDALASGWRVEIREGCNKTIDTCRSRFANARQFQGEPYLPGMDLLTRYPGG